MKQITYGIFAEDAAIRIFIRAVISQLVAEFEYDDKVAFKDNALYSDSVIGKSGGYVRKNFLAYVLRGLTGEHKIDLCFIGLDCDNHEHSVYFEKMQNELIENRLEKKALIVIPVQAIEYWLWYQKEKLRDNQLTKTPVIDKTEDRQTLKEWVYESTRKRISNKKSNKFVISLSKNLNIPWLRAHSASFNHFCEQFENYLKTNI